MDRKSGGGLGDLKYPLISDVTKSISKYFGVLIPDQVRTCHSLLIVTYRTPKKSYTLLVDIV